MSMLMFLNRSTSLERAAEGCPCRPSMLICLRTSYVFSWYSSSCKAFFSLALLALEVVDDRLDGDRRPRTTTMRSTRSGCCREGDEIITGAFHRLALLSLVQEVFVVIGREVGLRACLAAEGLAVADLLQVVEAAGDALVARGVEGVEGDAGATVHAGVDLGAGQDRVQVCVHDAGGRRWRWR